MLQSIFLAGWNIDEYDYENKRRSKYFYFQWYYIHNSILFNESISLNKIHIVNGFCGKLEMANWKPYP